MVGHLDDQRGGRSHVDMHLRAVAEEDHLLHDTGDRIAPLSNRLVGALHGDAFGPDDDGRLTLDRRVGSVVDRRAEAGVERRAHR